MNKSVRFSLRNKLFFGVFFAFTLLIVLIIWQIRQQASIASNNSVNASLKQTTTILNTILDGRFYSIKEVATGISSDGRVLPLVFEEESLTLQDLSLEFQQSLEFDSLLFISRAGRVLARSDRPNAVGMSLLGKSRLFDEALSGKTTQGYIVSGNKILQMVVKPIFDNVANDLVRGLVAVAYELSAEVAHEMKVMTASDVSFFRFSRDEKRNISGVESTQVTNGALRIALEASLNQTPRKWQDVSNDAIESSVVTLHEELYFSLMRTLSSYDGRPLGFIMTLQSRSELIKPFARIERAVLIVGILCFMTSVVLAMIFAYRMSQPVLRLVQIAGNIEDGQYPEGNTQKNAKPRDEIDLLYNSVIKMGTSIREKNELETYLAGLANSLDVMDQAMDAPANVHHFAGMSVAQAMEGDSDETVLNPRLEAHVQEEPLFNRPMHRRAIDRIEIGSVIDKRYTLRKLLGAGVFGTVFLAQDTELDEHIAIKIMDKNRLEHAQHDIDLHEEIKLARRITHRNITRTYDFGAFDSFIYITMEYVDGFTLNGLVHQKGAIHVYPAMILVKQLCSAMHAAHEQGIIHRDLKPQNISIDQRGVLKIMDFGLAISLTSISEKRLEEIQKIMAGTPRFMAPEQFVGGKLDVRTDIYALGILMFYIFVGDAPYQSKSIEALMALHCSAVIPSMRERNAEIPEVVESIAYKAMQSDPENRFQSAKEMFDALNNAI